MFEPIVTRTVSASTSRRDLLRRIASLGLVAASGIALSPLIADGKGSTPQAARRSTRRTRQRDRDRARGRKAKGKASDQEASASAAASEQATTDDPFTRAAMVNTITYASLGINKSGSYGKIHIVAQAKLDPLVVNQIRSASPTATYWFRFNLWERDNELFDSNDDLVEKYTYQIRARDLVTDAKTKAVYATVSVEPMVPWTRLRSFGGEYYVGVHLRRLGDGQSGEGTAVATPKETNEERI